MPSGGQLGGLMRVGLLPRTQCRAVAAVTLARLALPWLVHGGAPSAPLESEDQIICPLEARESVGCRRYRSRGAARYGTEVVVASSAGVRSVHRGLATDGCAGRETSASLRLGGLSRPFAWLATVACAILLSAAWASTAYASTGAVAATQPQPLTVGWLGGTDVSWGTSLTSSPGPPAFASLPNGVQVRSAAIGVDGNGTVLAIGTDGNLYAWGENQSGELGDGSYTSRSAPEQVSLPGGVAPAQVAANEGTSYVLGQDGAVYATGLNNYGQLGDGSTANTTDTFQEVSLPSGVTAVSVAAAGDGALVAGSDGKVYTWGVDQNGQLGDGMYQGASASTPQVVPLPSGVTAVSVQAGWVNGYALTSAGAVYSWGQNSVMLGNATAEGSSSSVLGPVAVQMPSGVTVSSFSADPDEASTAAGDVLAIGSDGNLYGWGFNNFGELGDGTQTAQSAPEKLSLPGGEPPSTMSAGPDVSYVVDSTGKIYSAGLDAGYDLGATAAGAGGAATSFQAIAQPQGFVAAGVYSGGCDGQGYNPVAACVTVIASGAATDAPYFTADSPPSSLAAGSAIDYTFAAGGDPAPTFALAPGAPSWLSIDSATGELTGTAPVGYGYASYSVLAENSKGTTTAGPFYLTDPGAEADLTGQLSGPYMNGVYVEACVESTTLCTHTAADSGGNFSLPAVVGTTVVVTAYPPRSVSEAQASSGPLLVPAGGLTGVDLTLPRVTALTFTVSGPDVGQPRSEPSMNWAYPTAIFVNGCDYGVGTVSLTEQDPTTGQWTFNLYPLTETAAGSGIYTAMISPQFPNHGPVNIDPQILCLPNSALEPNLGSASGGNQVLLSGSGFTQATAVHFGSRPATSFSVLNDDGIEAVAPAGSGTVPVTVTTPSGTQTVHDYTYQAVTSVSPASGTPAGGGTVTITGTGLGSVDQVTFGGVAAAFKPVSDTQLTATVPAGTAGATVDVTVRTVLGGTTPASVSDRFTYTQGAAGIGGTAPDATGAASVLAGGSGSSAATGVGIAAMLMPRDAKTLATALNYAIRQAFETNSGLRDAIDAGLGGFKASLKGDPCALGEPALEFAASKFFDATLGPLINAQIAEWAVAAVAATGPGALVAGAGVVLAGYAVKLAIEDTIAKGVAGMLLTAAGCPPPGDQPNALIDPSGNVLDTNGNPIGGATVTIQRSDAFAGPFTAVASSSPGILPNVNPETTDSSGTFMWDVSSGYYEVGATAPNCASPLSPGLHTATIGPYPVPPPQVGLTITMACTNEASPPRPTVSGLSAVSGPTAGGTVVQITGAGFTPASTVHFGSQAGTNLIYMSPRTLQVAAPAGQGSQDVTVTTAGGTSVTSAADRFFYGSVPKLTGLNAKRGPTAGGTSVTITGTGFTGATIVDFGYLPAPTFRVVSDTEITATTPESLPGTVDVTVRTPAGESATSSADHFTFMATFVRLPRSATASPSGRLRLKARCPAGEPECVDTVSLTVVVAAKHHRHKIVTITTRHVKLASGKTTTLKLKISRTGLSLLRKAKHHKLRVTAVIKAGTSPHKEPLTLKLE